MGIYQMIFPLYSLILTLTSSAMPSCLSSVVSDKLQNGEGDSIGSFVASAKKYLIVVCGVATLIFFFIAYPSAKLQGDIRGFLPYLIIAPSIFFVGLTTLYRGVFQGYLNMKVSALSQVIEQVVKLAFGLLIAYILRDDLILSVSGAVLAVTISEVVAYLYVRWKGKTLAVFDNNIKAEKGSWRRLLRFILPMTLAFSISPLICFIESRILIGSCGAVCFGLFAGCSLTIVGIPVALVSALGAVVIPSMSKGGQKDFSLISLSLRTTMIIVGLSAIGFFLLSNEIVELLFGGFNASERDILSTLIKYSSISVFLFGINLITTSILYGMGKPKIPLYATIGGGVLKLIVVFALVGKFGIISAVIGDCVLYFVASLVNLIYIIGKGKIYFPKGFYLSFLSMLLFSYIAVELTRLAVSGTVFLILAIIAVAIVGVAFLLITRVFDKDEKAVFYNMIKINKRKI